MSRARKLNPLRLTILFAISAWAADDTMLVSTEALAKQLGSESLVVLHVGSQKDYDTGHIPGARLVSLGDISITGERELRLELPPPEPLLSAFAALGVDEQSEIVIYSGADSVQSATRVWFTLDYLGMSGRASLLDGGLKAWRAEGRPVTAQKSEWQPKPLMKAHPRPELVVDAAYIQNQSRTGSIALIDARMPEFYSGASAGSMPRAGHVPGAMNLPFPTFFAQDGRFKPRNELEQMLSAVSGKPPVTYCHIGMQATVPYFVARYLGLQPKLYDGSFQDWSRRSELPVGTANSR